MPEVNGHVFRLVEGSRICTPLKCPWRRNRVEDTLYDGQMRVLVDIQSRGDQEHYCMRKGMRKFVSRSCFNAVIGRLGGRMEARTKPHGIPAISDDLRSTGTISS